MIARDISAISVSTVASKRACSIGGKFVSSHHNRLHPKTLEAFMCATDWLWSSTEPKDGKEGTSLNGDADVENDDY